jgi:hypothetical protein
MPLVFSDTRPQSIKSMRRVLMCLSIEPVHRPTRRELKQAVFLADDRHRVAVVVAASGKTRQAKLGGGTSRYLFCTC